MIRQLWALSAHTRSYLRRYMPTNVALDAIRTRRGLKWGIPAMLLAVPYFLAATYCTGLIEDGGPGWFHVLVLLFCWNALKFVIMGRLAPSSSFALAATKRRHVDTPHAQNCTRTRAMRGPATPAMSVELGED
ncbi:MULTISPECIES: sulfate permease [Microbacterium]|uniref:sulfate permease n=1 Tax=Microbacterium TaxID=33882 RepID=UPI0028A71AD7|nr:sulfate permease [Microbacterium sp.]